MFTSEKKLIAHKTFKNYQKYMLLNETVPLYIPLWIVQKHETKKRKDAIEEITFNCFSFLPKPFVAAWASYFSFFSVN